MENLLLADEIVCVASIFALGFFCAILPRTRIARLESRSCRSELSRS